MKDFWLMAKSPKEMFTEFIQKENPTATLWDIFTDYSLIFPENEPADTSEEWLTEQKEIINTIVTSDLANMPLTRIQIEEICCAIQEFTFGVEAQDIDYLDTDFIPVAKKITEEYIVPKKLTEATIGILLDRLQDQLEQRNEKYIQKTDKEVMRKMILDLPCYSEDKKQEILKNIEQVWEANLNGQEEEDFDDAVDDVPSDYNSEGYVWPEIGLAYSQTFYGFDDAGNLSYEEQERLAEETYDAYVAEITELLGEQPRVDLLPVNLNRTNDEWDVFAEFATQYLLAYEFEHKFTIWKGNDRVLFLILRKEDKELPYQIALGGMMLKEYKEIIEKYNGLVGKRKPIQ